MRTLPEGKRTLYVAPGGTGDGSDKARPLSLEAALARAQPGDRYWLEETIEARSS